MAPMTAAVDDVPPQGPAASPGPAAPAREEVFVRAIDLPTLSLAKAREAVALQLDILSPLPPGEVVSSTVLVGPADGGLTRFAVGLAPRGLFAVHAAEGARGPPAIRLMGRLDDQWINFRFDNPYRLEARRRAGRARLELATLAALCAFLVLGGVSIRLDREVERAQARADATDTLARHLSREAHERADTAAAWRSGERSRGARIVDCALHALGRGGGAPILLSGLAVEDGVATISFSRPLTAAQLSALQSGGGVAPVADSAGPGGVSQVLVNGAACR